MSSTVSALTGVLRHEIFIDLNLLKPDRYLTCELL